MATVHNTFNPPQPKLLETCTIRGELCRELAYHDAGHRCTHSGSPIAARPPATYDQENTSKALHAFGLSGAVGRPGSKRDESSHRSCEVSEGTSFQNSRPISSSLDPQTLQKYTRCSQDCGSSSIVIFPALPTFFFLLSTVSIHAQSRP